MRYLFTIIMEPLLTGPNIVYIYGPSLDNIEMLHISYIIVFIFLYKKVKENSEGYLKLEYDKEKLNDFTSQCDFDYINNFFFDIYTFDTCIFIFNQIFC